MQPTTFRSFIEYDVDCEFPLQNLPWGIFSTADIAQPRIGVAIGDQILDVAQIRHLFTSPALKDNQFVFAEVCCRPLLRWRCAGLLSQRNYVVVCSAH